MKSLAVRLRESGCVQLGIEYLYPWLLHTSAESQGLLSECNGVRHLCPLADSFQLHLGATGHFTKIGLHPNRATLAGCNVGCNLLYLSADSDGRQ